MTFVMSGRRPDDLERVVAAVRSEPELQRASIGLDEGSGDQVGRSRSAGGDAKPAAVLEAGIGTR